MLIQNVSSFTRLNVSSFTCFTVSLFTRLKCIFAYSFKCIFVYSFKIYLRLLVQMYLCLLDMTVFIAVSSEVLLCYENFFTQTDNDNRLIRMKFNIFLHHYRYILYYQCLSGASIARMKSPLNFKSYIETRGSFLSCSTKWAHECLTKETNFHICL